MRKSTGLFVLILILGLVIQPALATGDSIQGTAAGVRTYEIEIYGIPAKVIIAENSTLKTPEDVKAFIESYLSREEFINGAVVDISEASSKKQKQNDIIATDFLKEPISTTSVGTVLSGIVEVPAYAVYEYSDEIREKLDSAYQYFYNYIEERKKDEKTIHIYEREFYGGLPKRIYVKEFVHKGDKDFKVTVGELVDVIVIVPSGKLALNATVKNLKEGNWELAALKGIRFIIGATGEAVAYLAMKKVYNAENITLPKKPNEKGPDFPHVDIPNISLTKWEAKGTTVFRVTSLIRDGYYRNLEGQPGIVSVYRMYKSNLYVVFIYGSTS